VPDSLDIFNMKYPSKRFEYIDHLATSFIYFYAKCSFDKHFLTFEISTDFIPDSSYIVFKTEEILVHEQIHFNIAEVISREMKQELCNNINLYSDSMKFNKLFLEFNSKLNMRQCIYDIECKTAQGIYGTLEGDRLINKRWLR